MLDGSNSYCVFNSHTAAGLWTNNVCFQLPLLVTIAVNVHAFIRGIQALRNSPQSVSPSTTELLLMVLSRGAS
jgi:hypothetical protein